MPHKHVRKVENDKSFNLDPTQQAKPLPAFEKSASKDKKRKRGAENTRHAVKKQKKSIAGYGADDTPRAFARLMQQVQSGKRAAGGLDDGNRPTKKQLKKQKTQVEQPTEPVQHDESGMATKLERLPGESLRDFSIRVDQALPISGLAQKGKKVEGVKERRTKTEKRLHKMYDEWRTEEARIKAKEEEQAEKEEEDEENRIAEFNGQDVSLPMSKRAKKRRALGEVGAMEEDPWAVLKSKREAPKGLHDVAQAPPDFKAIPKERFNVRNGAKVSVANVPLAAGSLKKREELSAARAEVIERYRAMMKQGNQ